MVEQSLAIYSIEAHISKYNPLEKQPEGGGGGGGGGGERERERAAAAVMQSQPYV